MFRWHCGSDGQTEINGRIARAADECICRRRGDKTCKVNPVDIKVGVCRVAATGDAAFPNYSYYEALFTNSGRNTKYNNIK